jgi:putative sterol carrier protein
MSRFGKQWFETVVEKVKKDEDLLQKGKGFDSKIHFRVLQDRKAKLSNDVSFGMYLPSGEPNWYGETENNDVDIIIEGKAGIYTEVLDGKKNVVMALTIGAFKLKKGSIAKLTSNIGAVTRFIEVMGSVG